MVIIFIIIAVVSAITAWISYSEGYPGDSLVWLLLLLAGILGIVGTWPTN